jgi:hypothetical protein
MTLHIRARLAPPWAARILAPQLPSVDLFLAKVIGTRVSI